MEIHLTKDEIKKIGEGIKGKYARVSLSPEGFFKYPIGRAAVEALRYDPAWIQTMPEKVMSSYCGVGNPFQLGPISPGESVLDIGCGVGVDSLIAGLIVGPTGKVVGIDLTPEMVNRAKENLQETDLKQVQFQVLSGEKLDFEDNSFDVVISNGVFNLIPNKLQILKEVFRVLKPGGRLMIADQILAGKAPEDREEKIKSWFR